MKQKHSSSIICLLFTWNLIRFSSDERREIYVYMPAGINQQKR